jgi:twitching motility two-component system response regulator PilH
MNMAATRVMLIDDDEIQNEMLKGALEMYSMVVATERNPMNVLKIARKFTPHVIVCDLVMPGRTGSRVARELHEHPATRHIPILFLSSLVTRREEEANTTTRIMMAKPVNTPALVEHIRRLANPPEKKDPAPRAAASRF